MTTYIDVTRLLDWQVRYSGMELIAYELAKQLQEQEDIKLCYFTPSRGFIDISGQYEFKNELITSSIFGSGPGLRQLLKTNKKAFAKHAVKRKVNEAKQKNLNPIEQGKNTTLLILDGLWDRQNYIDEVVKHASEGTRIAHLIHDAVPLIMPQVCFDYVTEAYEGYFDRIAPLTDILFFTSQSSAKDFSTWYDKELKPEVKKVVIRYADELKRIQPVKPTDVRGIDGDFILAVSTIEVRKNYPLLYQVYKLALERNIKLPKLIIVGREGWLVEPFIRAVKYDPTIKGSVILAGPIDDAALTWLYKNCLFTICPSLYEGWGLSVSQSLFFGKVCASSSYSSMPEIGGDLNVYFSPYSTDECLSAITQLVDSGFRSKRERAIKEKYQLTKWEDTARGMYSALEAK